MSVTESLGFHAHFPLVIFAGYHQAELGFFLSWCLKIDLES